MSKFILLSMIFMHILDDFWLQAAWLSSGKQKSWWEKNVPNDMGKHGLYRNDYKVALLAHGCSWAFMMMLPIACFFNFNPPGSFYWIVSINAIAHAVIDHLKANCHAMNLIADQSLHLVQIIATWSILLGGF